MEALRIVLHQNSANYKKEETIENKMTYPLPPFSTVIGAIHSACGFKEYKKMDISIQGKFESMHREPYTDYCFANNVEGDRGILVKMRNETLLSSAFDKVASAKKPQGNSFVKGITIQVHNEELLKEYQQLDEINNKIKEFKTTRIKRVLELIKKRKKTLSEEKKSLDKKSNEYKKVVLRENEIKNHEKEINERMKQYELENYVRPISKFRVLTTSLKFYEILDNVDLVIHVRTEDKDILYTIAENIYNLKSIGRSEDFVEIKNTEIVELMQDDDVYIESEFSAYLDYDSVKDECIFTKVDTNRPINGTKYYLNKNYAPVTSNGKRIFEKKKVLYASNYFIEETSKNVWIDKNGETNYIVNFI